MSFHQTQCRHYCIYIKALISARDLPDVKVHILTLWCSHVAVSVHCDSSHHQKVHIHACIFAPLLVFRVCTAPIWFSCCRFRLFIYHRKGNFWILDPHCSYFFNLRSRPKTKTNLKVIGWYEYWQQDDWSRQLTRTHCICYHTCNEPILPLYRKHDKQWQIYIRQSLSQQLLPKGTRCGMGISQR